MSAHLPLRKTRSGVKIFRFLFIMCRKWIAWNVEDAGWENGLFFVVVGRSALCTGSINIFLFISPRALTSLTHIPSSHVTVTDITSTPYNGTHYVRSADDDAGVSISSGRKPAVHQRELIAQIGRRQKWRNEVVRKSNYTAGILLLCTVGLDIMRCGYPIRVRYGQFCITGRDRQRQCPARRTSYRYGSSELCRVVHWRTVPNRKIIDLQAFIKMVVLSYIVFKLRD